MSGATFPILVQIPSLGPATLPINPDTDYTVVSQNGIARKVTVSDFIVGNFATLGANTFTGKQTLNGTPVGLQVANDATIGGSLSAASLSVSGGTNFGGNVTAGRGSLGTGNGVLIGSSAGQSIVQNVSASSSAELYIQTRSAGGITFQTDAGTLMRMGPGNILSVGTSQSLALRATTAGQTISMGSAGLGTILSATVNSNGNSLFGSAPNDVAIFNRLSVATMRSFGGTFTLNGTVTPTAFSGTGTTATVTFAAITGVVIPVGSRITITGASPSGYNVSDAVVTASTPTSVSYANTTTGSLVTAGTMAYRMQPPQLVNFVSNWTGTSGTNGNFYPYIFSIASDTADTSASPLGAPLLRLARNWGGAAKGGKVGLQTVISHTSATNDPVVPGVPNQQHVVGEFWAQSSFNAGGTGSGALAAGSFYGFNPQVLLRPGATYWRLANGLGEVNLAVFASERTLTIGGTVTAGDTLSITFASADIAGTPVTVSWTVGANQTLGMIANNLCAAIRDNAALTDAKISAAVSGAVLTIYWYTHIAALTITTGLSGGATETMTLGSVVDGASTDIKVMGSMIRLSDDSAPATLDSAFLMFAGQTGSGTAGLFNHGLRFGALNGYNGEWSWHKGSSLISTGLTTSYGAGALSAPLVPNWLQYGINFSDVAFFEGGSLNVPGFLAASDSSGAIYVGGYQIAATAGDLQIDTTTGATASAVALASGGGGGAGVAVNNYFKGDVGFDSYGGSYEVTGVNASTGAVTAFNVLVYPSFRSGSAPANPLAVHGGSGLNWTVNATWPSSPRLYLQPTGGAVVAGGYYSTSTGYRWNATPFISANPTYGQTVLGYNAGLNLNTASIETTVIGHYAGGSGGVGITGTENTLVGWHSGYAMTTGGFNTALGVNTMGFETTGNNNVAVGTDAMRNSVALIANVAVGAHALRNGAGTISSVAVGHEALKGDETTPSTSVGSDLIAIGYQAMYSATRTSASGMVAIGTRSGTAITTANGGVLVGHESGKALTTALHAVGVGYQSLLKLTTGAANIAVGRNTLQEITTEANNVAVGHLAGQTLTGAGNTLVGKGAGAAATTADNMVAVGIDAGKNVTGDNNIILGGAAGSTTLTSGSNNILIGNVNADVASASDSATLKIAMAATPIMTATAITGTPVVSFDGGSISIGAAGAPTITSGAGAPATTTPKGSLYLRTGGGVGTTLYVSQGGGSWNAVAGV